MELRYSADSDEIEARVTVDTEEELRAELLMNGAGLYGMSLEHCRLLRAAISSPKSRALLADSLVKIRRNV